MREIKFRAKRYNNEWVYGNYVKAEYLSKNGKYEYFIIEFKADGQTYEVNENTISQFTGLYDKNGKEIYENDIVEWAGYTMKILWGEDCGVGYGFIWEPCGSNIDYVESMTGFIDEYEVIGNIFDNPELLGEQQ